MIISEFVKSTASTAVAPIPGNFRIVMYREIAVYPKSGKEVIWTIQIMAKQLEASPELHFRIVRFATDNFPSIILPPAKLGKVDEDAMSTIFYNLLKSLRALFADLHVTINDDDMEHLFKVDWKVPGVVATKSLSATEAFAHWQRLWSMK